jgi:hypothetical protein
LLKIFSSKKISAAGRFLFFAGSKNRPAVGIPQRDSAERAFNKLARTFAAHGDAQAIPGRRCSSRLDLAARRTDEHF